MRLLRSTYELTSDLIWMFDPDDSFQRRLKTLPDLYCPESEDNYLNTWAYYHFNKMMMSNLSIYVEHVYEIIKYNRLYQLDSFNIVAKIIFSNYPAFHEIMTLIVNTKFTANDLAVIVKKYADTETEVPVSVIINWWKLLNVMLDRDLLKIDMKYIIENNIYEKLIDARKRGAARRTEADRMRRLSESSKYFNTCIAASCMDRFL